MGITYKATCKECGKEFELKDGGGFFFHLLRCDKCGKDISVGFDEIKDIHYRYLKGLEGPYCVASAGHDKYVRENLDIEPISRETYHELIEKKLSKCRCGGVFTFKAQPRCPKCKSLNLKIGEITLYYD